VVYARRLGGRSYTFQVSGMLWRNSLVMRDRETGSLWSHVTGEGLCGPMAGEVLEPVPVTTVFWFAWSSFYPNTRVVE